MSLLDNDNELFENTDIKNWGFPKYEDFEKIGASYPIGTRSYWWLTKYYGDSIIKEGISISIHEQPHNKWDKNTQIIYTCEYTYHMIIRIGGDDQLALLDHTVPWTNFLKIHDSFNSWEEAQKVGYNLLCFFKEHRDFFEVLCKRFKYNGGRFRIPKPFYIKEIYNYNNYESIR